MGGVGNRGGRVSADWKRIGARVIVSWLLFVLLQQDPLIIGIVGDYKTREACERVAKSQSDGKTILGCMSIAHESI
jgi:hypothetical protein